MPPRAAKSPARSPGRPAKSPPPSRPSPSPKPSASAVRQRKGTPKKKAEEEAKEAPETGTAEAPSPATTEAPAPAPVPAAPPAPATAPTNGKDPEGWKLLDYLLVAIFIILLGALAYTLYPAAKKAKKASVVPFLSPKAFDGEALLSSVGYKGSALVAFTVPECFACEELKPIFADAKKELDGKLKFGQVNCNKHDELCSRFGVSGDETALGYPWIGWFKGGVEQGGYTGDKEFAADFTLWYKAQEEAANLTAA